jgi:hypothetical protein
MSAPELGVSGLGRAGSLSTLQSNNAALPPSRHPTGSARGQPVRPPEGAKFLLGACLEDYPLARSCGCLRVRTLPEETLIEPRCWSLDRLRTRP